MTARQWLTFYSHMDPSNINSYHGIHNGAPRPLFMPCIGSKPSSIIWVLVLQRKSLPAVSWQQYFIFEDFQRVLCSLCHKKCKVKWSPGRNTSTCGRVCLRSHLKSVKAGFWFLHLVHPLASGLGLCTLKPTHKSHEQLGQSPTWEKESVHWVLLLLHCKEVMVTKNSLAKPFSLRGKEVCY